MPPAHCISCLAQKIKVLVEGKGDGVSQNLGGISSSCHSLGMITFTAQTSVPS